MRKINKLIIHCTDSPDKMDLGMDVINGWHKARNFTPFNGWIYCGYNYVIRRSGIVENPRPDSIPGIHCSGHNADSIGICWVGKHTPSERQIDSLIVLCRSLISTYKLKPQDIHGHNEYSSKTCPNLDMDEIIKLVEEE